MDQKHLKNVLFFLLALAAAHCAKAINYVVSNNAEASTGAARFDKEIAAEFIQKLFQQNNSADIKTVEEVGVIIENIDGLAFASNDIIHISAGYIEKYREDVKKEIAGLIYHEMAHILQWDGNGKAPSGLTEGIADFMRMKAGYASDLWSPAGVGDQWDQGYEVTAHFLHYCDNLKNGFVADLNKKLKTDYSESYFNDLLGKPVAQLWSDYKAMYNN
ncbi:peptidase M [Medicago truncatula]|uniref:Peptidase M n=1 Tax=Medicago truncatula TaxID=3880 RepID=A0A072VQI8_MEDTR|nr:peptidase M [Medicago truncatula]